VAPKIGTRPNTVSVDCDIPAKGNGVLFSLGAFSGGPTCFMENGFLVYEYNLFEVERTVIRSKTKLPAGRKKLILIYVSAITPAILLLFTQETFL
jgi:arylsulfatase